MDSRTTPPAAALVTGAASGIGQYCAEALSARGTRVAAVDVDQARLHRVAETSPLITPFVCDVSDEHQVQTSVKAAQGAVGPFDRVIHCAGVARLGRLREQSSADIERVWRVNYLGTVHVARATITAMTDRGAGDLMVMASIAGWVPVPSGGAYGASKAAVMDAEPPPCGTPDVWRLPCSAPCWNAS
ncbi:SDR family NAD(P)-dependent oxidoreductase [Streptomyces sp. RGM 3693]|uniref:SDR family NAD(P)-dependent oxidoreductase n=1 Tax=Streptomyces sp. RGM 3693 TaxID=3413284 RepID=UPI003D2DFFA4